MRFWYTCISMDMPLFTCIWATVPIVHIIDARSNVHAKLRHARAATYKKWMTSNDESAYNTEFYIISYPWPRVFKRCHCSFIDIIQYIRDQKCRSGQECAASVFSYFSALLAVWRPIVVIQWVYIASGHCPHALHCFLVAIYIGLNSLPHPTCSAI